MTLSLRRITIAQLVAYAHEVVASNNEVIPITIPRATSQAMNPKANPDDVVLTVASYGNNDIVGYIGALPDRVGSSRCAWNSCWWVKPGTPPDVSLRLLLSFLTDWDQRVIFSEMTPRTSLLIEKLNFCTHIPVAGFRGYIRLCLAEVLPQKKPLTRRFAMPLRVADCLGNALINLKVLLFGLGAKSPLSLQHTYIPYPMATDDPFIQRFNADQPAKRYSADFQWVTNHPWVHTKPMASSTVSKRYHFTYAVGRFETKWVRFTNDGQTWGLVGYSIRDKHLKLQYVYAESQAMEHISCFFYRVLASDPSLCTITTFHAGLVRYLSKRAFLFRTYLPKLTAQSNKLIANHGEKDFTLQMGDGDCIFT